MSVFDGIAPEIGVGAEPLPGAAEHAAEPPAIAFGRFLRQLRTRRGLSLANVCELAKPSVAPLDKGTLSRLERGQQAPSVLRLGPLSRIYQISADALLERMELDREVERVRGAAGESTARRTWDEYACLRDALSVSTNAERVPAWMAFVATLRSLGKNALALHELLALSASEAPMPLERAWIHQRLSQCYRSLGAMKRAEEHAETAIDRAQALGDPRTLAHAYATRASAAMDQEQWSAADELLLKALAANPATSPSFEVQGLLMLADCSFHLNSVSRARHLTLTARKLSDEHDLPLGLAGVELLLGLLDEVSGLADQATRRWRKAAALAAKLEDPPLAFAAELAIYRQALEAGEGTRARASRRRLEHWLPWMLRHAPAYRRFKQLTDDSGSRPDRTSQRERRPSHDHPRQN